MREIDAGKCRKKITKTKQISKSSRNVKKITLVFNFV